MKNCIVAQSGGPTVAINASLSGVIRGALESDKIDKIYGGKNGIQGILEEKLVVLNDIFGDGNNGEDMLKLQIIFNNQQLELNDYLSESLKLISDMTSYTAVVLGKASHDNLLKEVNVVPLTNNQLIIIVVTDKGKVEHKTVTLDQVNMSDVKKTVYNAAKNLMFEQNSDVLWVNFLSQITPLLDKLMSGQGLSNYKIIKKATKAKAKLEAVIKLYPIYAVEEFEVTIELSDEDVSVV